MDDRIEKRIEKMSFKEFHAYLMAVLYVMRQNRMKDLGNKKG